MDLQRRWNAKEAKLTRRGNNRCKSFWRLEFVRKERRVQANIEKARLEERLRREQAEAAAKAREAEDNPPCLDGTGKCPPKND